MSDEDNGAIGPIWEELNRLAGRVATLESEENRLRSKSIGDRLAKLEAAQAETAVVVSTLAPGPCPRCGRPCGGQCPDWDEDDHGRTQHAEMKRLREERDHYREKYIELQTKSPPWPRCHVDGCAAPAVLLRCPDHLTNPAPLRWTRAVPTAPGWWWKRATGCEETTEMVRVIYREEWGLVCHTGRYSGLLVGDYKGSEWSDRPIPMPEEG